MHLVRVYVVLKGLYWVWNTWEAIIFEEKYIDTVLIVYKQKHRLNKVVAGSNFFMVILLFKKHIYSLEMCKSMGRFKFFVYFVTNRVKMKDISIV